MKFNKRKIIFVIIAVVVLATLVFVGLKLLPTEYDASQDKYQKNPELLQGQDQSPAEEAAQRAEEKKHPLIQELPYQDEQIKIEIVESSPAIKLQVLHTSTLAAAQARYSEVLKRFGDSGSDYQIEFFQTASLE